MDGGEAAGDLNRLDRIIRFHGTHRDDQRGRKDAGPSGFYRRPIHRHIPAVLNMPNRRIGREKRFLERKRAAGRECHEIVEPDIVDVLQSGDKVAVLPDAVAWQVGADVEVVAERRNHRRTGIRHADQRAGFWISLAEQQEITSEIARQNR